MLITRFFYLAFYYGFAQFLPPSDMKYIGKIGKISRRYCAKKIFKYCGQNVNIEHRAFFGKGYNIEIGDNSGIGIHCHVPNDIKIGDNVMMGPHCHFMDNSIHGFERLDIPMIQQGVYRKKGRTEIGNDVWIGRQCLITPCKKIGNHTVIGGGSVVCKDVPDSVVAGGNPIKIIRYR